MKRITNDDIRALAEDTGASFTCAEYAVDAAKYLLGVVAENAPTDAILAQAGFMLTEHDENTVYSQICGISVSPLAMIILKDSGSLGRGKAYA